MLAEVASALLYLLFALLYSTFLFGLHRKLVARMQNRKGPPLLQPLYDLIKLMGKENLSYRASNHEIWLSFALLSAALACLMVVPFKNSIYSAQTNIILVVLLLSAAYLFVTFAGLGSFSAFSEIGGMRALVQFLSFEGAFLLTTLWPAYYVARDMTIPLAINENLITVFPFLGVVYLLTILPQLNLQPFNIPNAHQEIVTGYATEFSSVPYAITEMVTYLKLYTLISLFILLYLNGPLPFLQFLLASIAIVLFLSAVRASLARTRIKNTLKIYALLTILVAMVILVRVYV